MSPEERQANKVISDACHQVLGGEQPVIVDTRIASRLLRWLLNHTRHIHTPQGKCLVNRAGAVCDDEMDWWHRSTGTA